MDEFTAKTPATVAIGMSGGVDSAVAAYLLKKQGFDLLAIFMKNWEEEGSCTAVRDYEDVTLVCEQIQIPYYTVNFTQEYWDEVFAKCLEEFKEGKTPNPDVLCNREIKFKILFDKARYLGADYLATGHYCRHLHDEDGHYLAKGLDPNKDQSYFLYAMEEPVLEHVLFPLGAMKKTEVKEIARREGFVNADKKESMGVCFVGKRKFRPFLQGFLGAQPGDFTTLDGKVVGRHEGSSFYTIGQRKGMGIGGPGEAWFVVGKDVEKNIVYVEQGEDHPALLTNSLKLCEPTWVSGSAPSFPLQCKAKIRYRQEATSCVLDGEDVHFEEDQRAVTPGQSIVFYKGDLCLGGGKIVEAVSLAKK